MTCLVCSVVETPGADLATLVRYQQRELDRLTSDLANAGVRIVELGERVIELEEQAGRRNKALHRLEVRVADLRRQLNTATGRASSAGHAAKQPTPERNPR